MDLAGELGFATTFSAPEAGALKLFEVDKALLEYLQRGGSLHLKAERGQEVVACTDAATFSITIIESSNSTLIFHENGAARSVPLDPATDAANPVADARYTVEGSVPCIHELRRIMPSLHHLRGLIRPISAAALTRFRRRCEHAAVDGVAAGVELPPVESAVEGAVATTYLRKRRRVDGAEPLADCLPPGAAGEALRASVQCSDAELIAGLESLQAMRVPESFIEWTRRKALARAASLSGAGAVADDEADRDASAEEDDDPLAAAAALATAAGNRGGAISLPAYMFAFATSLGGGDGGGGRPWSTGTGTGTGIAYSGLWSTLGADYAEACLEAVAGACSLRGWPLDAIPVAACLEELGPRFPRFVARQALCVSLGAPVLPPTAAAATTNDERAVQPHLLHAALRFDAVARFVGGRALMRLQLGEGRRVVSTVATTERVSAAEAGEEEEPSLEAQFLGMPDAAVPTAIPSEIAAALLSLPSVPADRLLGAWAAAMPYGMVITDGEEGEGEREGAARGRLSLALLQGVALLEPLPQAASLRATAAAAASAAESAAALAAAFSRPPASAVGSGGSSAAALDAATALQSAPGLRYFPASLLAPDAGPRFQQLFAARPRWALQDLAPFLAPLTGAPGSGGRSLDELLLAHTRLTNLPDGGRLFSAR